MKKTAFMLLAFAAMAQAAETQLTYDNLLASEEGWTISTLRHQRYFTIDTLNETASLTGSLWSQSYVSYDFSERPVCATADIPLTFSVTMQRKDNGAYTLSLIGTENAIVIGSAYDGSKILYGTTTNLDAKYYGFGNVTSAGYGLLSGTETSSTYIADEQVTISGTSSYNAANGTFSLNLNVGGTAYTINDLSSMNVTRLVMSGDGGNSANVVYSNLSLTGATPEPATATLSLLALAGLAARRRRH